MYALHNQGHSAILLPATSSSSHARQCAWPRLTLALCKTAHPLTASAAAAGHNRHNRHLHGHLQTQDSLLLRSTGRKNPIRLMLRKPPLRSPPFETIHFHQPSLDSLHLLHNLRTVRLHSELPYLHMS